MTKRTTRGRASKNKTIRCNKPDWRKEVIGREGQIKFIHRGKKIKGKKWIKTEQKKAVA